MARELTFTCPLPNGLHARPASELAEVAGHYHADVTLTNERTGAIANAKSVLALLATDVRLNDPCRLHVTGDDEDTALTALSVFITNVLPGLDELLPPVASAGSVYVPRVLAAAGVACLSGTGASQGIGSGCAVVLGGTSLIVPSSSEVAEGSVRERERLLDALAAVRMDLSSRINAHPGRPETRILKAHLAIISDVSLSDVLLESIAADGTTAGQAVRAAAEFFSERLKATESAYLHERAIDIQDLCVQLLERIYGKGDALTEPRLVEPSVVVAEQLAPSRFLALDRKYLRGLVLGAAGATSHTVILARSFGIPTVVGIPDAHYRLVAGLLAIVDGIRGLVIPDPPAVAVRFYEREQETLALRLARYNHIGKMPTATADGCRLMVGANVSTADDVKAAIASGAEGVGLFRTEMLFMERDAAPSEEEQYAIYSRVARAAGPHPAIIRTLDVGGDKPLPYVNLPHEDNPFLGVRGLRLYSDYLKLFRTQLRAIILASAQGNIWVMAPMVSTLGEARWFREQVTSVQAEVAAEGWAYNPSMPVGIMVETPAAAFMLDHLCEVLDFFSIGTNDLAQYTLAVDRDNARVASLYNPRHPSFLRLLRQIITAVHDNGRWVGICGEMVSDPVNLPLLIGLGPDELSLAPAGVPAMKAGIAGMTAAECRTLSEAALAAEDCDKVTALLSEARSRFTAQPLIAPDITVMASDSCSKAEVIRELVDRLYSTGRTDCPDRIEEAVWAREATYSTGLGHGFAIPHCKTDDLNSNALAIARLKQPVEWGALDGQPVRMVLLPAVRESDAKGVHMRILAQLSRKLMHQEFRDNMLAMMDCDSLLSYLAAELEIT